MCLLTVPKVATIDIAIKVFKKSGIFPFDINAVDFSRIVKHKGDGDSEGDQDVQEEAAVNVLGNVINEMEDRLEVAIDVEIETTGANTNNEIQEDEIQTITQSADTQQENIESTEQPAVQHSEQEQAKIMHEPEAENAQHQSGEMMHEPEAENAQQQLGEARDINKHNFNFGVMQVSPEPE